MGPIIKDDVRGPHLVDNPPEKIRIVLRTDANLIWLCDPVGAFWIDINADAIYT